MNGVIKRLVRDRGFGFIRPEKASDELFFHRSALQDVDFSELTEGQRVSFEVGKGQGDKGPRAEQVRVIE